MILVARAAWGAVPPRSTSPLPLALGFVVVHHTVTAGSGGSAEVRAIQRGHMAPPRNYADIGYNFLIGPAGEVYEGRGWRVRGAHCDEQNMNSRSIGIAFLGNMNNRPPTPLAIEAFGELLASGVTFDYLIPAPVITTHRAIAQNTACPGSLTDIEALRKSYRKEIEMPEEKPNYVVNYPVIGIAAIFDPTKVKYDLEHPEGIPGTGQGYLVLHADGGIATFGTAEYLGRTTVRSAP